MGGLWAEHVVLTQISRGEMLPIPRFRWPITSPTVAHPPFGQGVLEHPPPPRGSHGEWDPVGLVPRRSLSTCNGQVALGE